MKIATVVTIVVAVVYAVYLWVLSNLINLPVEKTLTFYSHNWLEVPLSFEVSCWWNLLIFPLIIMCMGYVYSSEVIVGKEPRGVKDGTGYKYNARLHVFIMKVLFMIATLAMMFMGAVMYPFFPEGPIGPLSLLVSSIILGLIAYIGFSSAIEFMYSLFIWNTFIYEDYSAGEKGLAETYQMNLSAFSKLGLIKTLPFLFGMTLGYICRFIFYGSLIFLKSIRISIQKQEKISTL